MEIGEVIKILESIKINGLSKLRVPIIKNIEIDAINTAIKVLEEKNKENK